jgi:hypothetical protein
MTVSASDSANTLLGPHECKKHTDIIEGEILFSDPHMDRQKGLGSLCIIYKTEKSTETKAPRDWNSSQDREVEDVLS